MKTQNVNDQMVFHLTKIIHQDMKSNFNLNYIGSKSLIHKFQLQSIATLYPSQQHKPFNYQLESQNLSNQTYFDDKSYTKVNHVAEQIHNEKENSDQQSSVSNEQTMNKISLKNLCLHLGVGNFICCKSSPPDPVYQDLGLGICLYLKFMKHLVFTLVILSILPIMQIVFFYSVSSDNNFQPKSSYQKTLFSLTMGTLSLQGIRCAHKKLSKASIYSFDLSCPIGLVRVLGPVYSDSTVSNLRVCKQDMNFLLGQAQSNYTLQQSQFAYTTNCDNLLQTCTYNISLSSQSSLFSDISLTFECINGKSKLGGVQISRSTVLLCNVIFDLIIVVVLIIFYLSETIAESKQKAWFKSKQFFLNQFTLEIGNFSKNNFTYQFNQFLSKLKIFIEVQNGIQKDLFKNIVQIRLPDNTQFLKNQTKISKSYNKLYKFWGKTFFDKKRDPSQCKDLQDFINFCFDFDKDHQQYKYKLIPLVNKYLKQEQKQGKNKQENLHVFMVFSQPKYKKYLMQNSKKIGISRYLIFDQNQDKKYWIKQAPPPTLVLWDNKNKGKKILRNILSWGLTIIIIAVTYVLIAFMLYQRNKLLKTYNFNIQCSTFYPGNSFSSFDQSLYALNNQAYTHCYCLSKSFFLGFNNQSQCSSWSLNYTFYVLIPIIFSIVIVVINIIVTIIFKSLCRFQAHTHLTVQVYSYIIKKSLLLILNMALFITVLSIDTRVKDRTSDFSFLFSGNYLDITADWYLQVGLIITITLIFNLLSPFVQSIVFVVMKLVKKLQIYMFNNKKRHYKVKSTYIQLYRGQIFPIEQRYALIIAVMTICLSLNCVFPIMTLILLLNLLFIGLIDKILIIKAFQKPINFDTQLHSKFMKSLIVIILIHLAATAVLISEPFLLVAGDTSLQGSIKQVNRNRFSAFFQTGYIIPYVILFVGIILSIVVNIVGEICLKCKPNEKVTLGLDGIPVDEHKFYHLLGKYEMSRTLAINKKEIQKVRILQQKYMKQNIQQSQDKDIKQNQKKIKQKQKLKQKQNLQQPQSSVEFPYGIQLEQIKKEIVPPAIVANNKQQQSILIKIMGYNIRKLQYLIDNNKMNKQNDIKLVGLTVYDKYEDWVYFNEHTGGGYYILGLKQSIRQNKLQIDEQNKQGSKIFNYNQ